MIVPQIVFLLFFTVGIDSLDLFKKNGDGNAAIQNGGGQGRFMGIYKSSRAQN
jgi:hypothetical protein